MVQGLRGFHCGGRVSIPGWGANIPQAEWRGQKKKKLKTKRKKMLGENSCGSLHAFSRIGLEYYTERREKVADSVSVLGPL